MIAPPKTRRCAVIGAGISGAGVAQALAQRGWAVTVLEQEPTPAAGTSGLPVALAVPQVSADDAPRSQLVRLGIDLLHREAHRHLTQGLDWSPSGVLERLPEGVSRWHAQGIWIKPSTLVRAWLAMPGITFEPRACITHIAGMGDYQWHVRTQGGQTWGEFDAVVLANAYGCKGLLRTLAAPTQVEPHWMERVQALQAVHGLMSYGRYPEPWPNLPSHPINGKGSFVPQLPDGDGTRWALGSTFLHDPLRAADIGTQHAQNLARLHFLVPDGGEELAAMLDRGKTEVWSSTRCTTRDRLPLVGPVPGDHTQGLWLCTGMGSRGLSLVVLCAELLAARMEAAPLPLDADLARHVGTERWMGAARSSAKG